MRRFAWMLLLGGVAACASRPAGMVSYRLVGDAIPEPLAAPGDAARGREVIVGRDGNCLLCHVIPETGKRHMGNVGPPLAGVGARLDAGQMRLRIVDTMRLNPDTVMPSYYRVSSLNRVAEPWRGKPILTAQQVEDAIAYLQTLR